MFLGKENAMEMYCRKLTGTIPIDGYPKSQFSEGPLPQSFEGGDQKKGVGYRIRHFINETRFKTRKGMESLCTRVLG